MVEEADADQREQGVAGGFEMIAGEDAEAAGINGEAIEESVLHRKIGDQQGIGRSGFEIGIEDFAGALIEG